jgi:methionyl-tRNA synthetase
MSTTTSNVPLGHTSFSWQSMESPKLGHTDYSWGQIQEGEMKESLEKRSGPLSKYAGQESNKLNKFYITTAINYTNGDPHVGHAYEGVTTDVVARYHRMFGRDTYFCTGTDEHGQKIAKTAEKEGCQPIDVCNKYAGKFQELNRQLLISNDTYIRTTEDRHKKVVRELWQRCCSKNYDGWYNLKEDQFVEDSEAEQMEFKDAAGNDLEKRTRGDIVLGKYEGWYNVKEEQYVKESDAEKMNYKDEAGNDLVKMSQESYLLNMGRYQDELIQKINSDEFLIRPKVRRDEILKFLNDEKLRPLSLSRNNFKWGIPIPGSNDHVMYVWFDALTNYGSAVNFLDTNSDTNPLAKFWPADVHVIGKDITRFHCIYWPIMLLSAGVPLPKGVYAHGFVMDKDGIKMSKSLGNVIDPMDMLKKYDADTLRFYMIRETIYGDDAPFNEEHLKDFHNSNLADSLGNLFRRGLSLCGSYTNVDAPVIPAEEADIVFDTAAFVHNLDLAMRDMRLKDYVMILLDACNQANKYLTDQAPWHLKGQPERQRAVVRSILECSYYFAHVLSPVCPIASKEMFKQMMKPPQTLRDLSSGFDNLIPGESIAIAKNSKGKRDSSSGSLVVLFYFSYFSLFCLIFSMCYLLIYVYSIVY